MRDTNGGSSETAQGVYPQAGHITLLAANNDFKTTAFRTVDWDGYFSGATYYSNPSGFIFPTKSAWWLRSPGSGLTYNADAVFATGKIIGCSAVSDYQRIRPVLSLNLSFVLFTSNAAASGKSSVAVGESLVSDAAPAGTVKFTMKGASQTLTINATTAQSTQTGETLSFSYSGATTEANQSISCVLIDDSGAVKYYDKLADSSSTVSGNLSVSLTGVANGTYTLKLFSEEANEDLYTDFCSEPVTMKVTLSNGSGAVSDFGGIVLHEHSWNQDTWSFNETHHWHECTAANCPIADDSQKDGYAGTYLRSKSCR